MKKMMLVLVATGLATVGFSQVRFGVQATGALNSASVSKLEPGMKKKSTFGFGAGIVSEISLSKQLSLRPSINFLQKGTKVEGKGSEGGASYEGKYEFKLNYVEVPVVLAYNVALPNAKAYFGAGPSFGYGVSGKTKVNQTITIPGFPTQTQSGSEDAFKKESEGGSGFKRFDVGANIIAGVQLDNGFFVNAGTLIGFSNLSGSEEGKYKNMGFHLTAGFLFKGKR